MANHDELEPIDLTGRWIGFYRHRFEKPGSFPITAEILQHGARLSGVMYDQITDRSESINGFIESYGDEISALHRRRIEALIDQFRDKTVEFHSHLPDASDILGTIEGHEVRFLKTYRGAYEIHTVVDENTYGTLSVPNHKVHYSGTLDQERSCLQGQWTIRRPGLLGRFLPPLGTGRFELYRKS